MGLSDREIHRLGAPIRSAALGLPDTGAAVKVLRDWGEAVWTEPDLFRVEAISQAVVASYRRVASPLLRLVDDR